MFSDKKAHALLRGAGGLNARRT